MQYSTLAQKLTPPVSNQDTTWTPPKMPGALVLINGFPGVGKHTIGYELVKLLPNCKFFDTRNLIAAATQLYSPTDPAHSLLRKNLKHAIFTSIARSTPTHFSPTSPPPPTFVLTDFLSVSARPSDRAIMHEFIAFARSAGFIFIHLVISCSTPVNVSRLTSPDRLAAHAAAHSADGTGTGAGAGYGSVVVIDEDSIVEMRMEEEIGHINVAGTIVDGLSGEYEVDTSDMDAKTSAAVLAEYCLDTLRAAGWWIQLNPKRRAVA